MERDKLDAAIEALQESKENTPGPGRKAVAPSVEQDSQPKRKLSAAGRRAIIAGTKKRWAAIRAAKAPVTAAPVVKRGLTDAGRKALSIPMKNRWAAKKKAGAKVTGSVR